MSKENVVPMVPKPKITLEDVLKRNGLTRNQLIALLGDVYIAEVVFKTEGYKQKAFKAQRTTFTNRRSALKESVDWKELMVRDIDLDERIKGIEAREKDVARSLFATMWPLLVPPADNSGEDHIVIKYLESKKDHIQGVLGLSTPLANKVNAKK